MIEPHREPRIVFYGMAAEHDILCWLCGVRPAVYDLNAVAFLPCWECGRTLHGKVYLVRSLWLRWLLERWR